jgi:ABC-type antimicrobial peptide transport system permease subunit
MKGFKENLWLALGTLSAHKMRSALTVLGVVIGVTCVIAIGSILTGMDRSISEELHSFGPENIYVAKFQPGIRVGPRSREERTRKPLSREDYEAIVASCFACRRVGLTMFSSQMTRVRYKGQELNSVEFHGDLANYAEVWNMTVASGRMFTDVENTHRSDVAAIGEDVRKTFFEHGDALDKEIEVNGHTFRVVGVFDKRTASAGESSQDLQFIVPYETMHKMYPQAKEHFIIAQAWPGRVPEAMDQIRAALRRSRKVPYDAPDTFGMATADSIMEQFHQITGAVALVMVVISSIGLLVGGVGVMNIMLMSVTERTREIGVRKAIGARRLDIIQQFLLEACTLTGSGGIIGILFGLLISLTIRALLPSLPSVVPLWAIFAGFLVSVSVGLFFGMWPAVKAARLDPVEALRYE